MQILPAYKEDFLVDPTTTSPPIKYALPSYYIRNFRGRPNQSTLQSTNFWHLATLLAWFCCSWWWYLLTASTRRDMNSWIDSDDDDNITVCLSHESIRHGWVCIAGGAFRPRPRTDPVPIIELNITELNITELNITELSCHVMSCHVMSCHVMSCHETNRINYDRTSKQLQQVNE